MLGYAVVVVPLSIIFFRWLADRADVATPRQVVHRLPLSTPFRLLLMASMALSALMGIFLLVAAVVGFDALDMSRPDMLGMALMSIPLAAYPWFILRYLPVVATKDHLLFLGGRVAWSDLTSMTWKAFGIKLTYPPSFRLGLTGEFTLNWFVWDATRADLAALDRIWREAKAGEHLHGS